MLRDNNFLKFPFGHKNIKMGIERWVKIRG